MNDNCSYDSEGKFLGEHLPIGGSVHGMANGNGTRLNGHAVTILIAILQVCATLAGGGLFIRSVEKAFETRMSDIEKKIDTHMVVAKKNQVSMSFHHTLGVTCSRGCHLDKSATFSYDGEK